MKNKRLLRSRSDKVVAGVFGGLGNYFNVDANLLRLSWILITVFTGFVPGLVIYILAALIIPAQ